MTKSKKSQFLIYSPQKPKSITEKFISEQFKTKLAGEENNDFTKGDFKEKIGEPHPFDYTIVEGVAKKFGLISAITDKISDFTLGPGLFIESDDEKAIEILEKWQKETKFKGHLRPWFREGLLKGAGYIEIAGLSDFEKKDTIKPINSNTMFSKRDDHGKVEHYTQFFGKNVTGSNEKEAIELSPIEIIQFNVNQIGSNAYGMGIVFSALPIINDFLNAQTSSHKLLRRKANSQIHVKLGDSEKDDYPEQKDIDDYGNKLVFMNDCTEWVTGPNVDMKVLDFGNIGEKFEKTLEHDLKLLSYSFQVPEIYLGADRGFAGSADVQKDAFGRNISSYQEQFGFVIKNKIFDVVLLNNGMNPATVDYKIVWGKQNDDEKNKIRESYTIVLSSRIMLSPGMRKEYEKKLALLDGIDFGEVETENMKVMRRENREKKQSFNQQLQLVNQKQNFQQEEISHDIMHELIKGKAIQEIESIISKKYDIDDKTCYRLVENEIEEFEKDYTLEEWIGEFVQIKKNILEFILGDKFEHLKATNRKEISLGKLNNKQIEDVRKIFSTGFEERQGLNKIASNLKKIGLKDRFVIKDGKKVLSISKEKRAFMLARTETVRLRAEGSLNRFQDKKIKEVTFTLVSARPCPQCEALAGKVFSIDESRGIIPVHGMCRCEWEQDEF